VTAPTRILVRALRQIARDPGLHAMTALALGLTCFLAAAFGTLLVSLNTAMTEHLGHVQFQIYWTPDAGMDEVRAQCALIRIMPGVDHVTSFTPQETLQSLAQTMGDGFDLSSLATAAPPSGVASFRVSSDDPAPAAEFLEHLKALPHVEDVRIAPTRLDMARAAHSLASKALLPLTLSLCAAIAAVAYLATRLCMEGRRAEVEILRLVGAGEWFVRLPWAASAALTGLAGSLAALAVLYAAVAALDPTLHTPPLWINLTPLPWPAALATVLLTTLMSALGGWLAARGRCPLDPRQRAAPFGNPN